MAKGEGTRSGLLWEVERLLNECDELPQVLLMENVSQVHSVKNKEHFNKWIEFLESKGYSNYWKDLNAKNFGIPQSRNRTFMVSILGSYTYQFPKEFPLELRLKDMLEDNVDEKFYISNESIESVVNVAEEPLVWDGYNQRIRKEKGTVDTLTTNCGADLKRNGQGIIEPQVIGGIGEKKSNGGTQWYLQDRIYDNNIATSIATAFNPYYKVEEPQERFFKQALETLAENDCSAGDTIDAFNKKVNSSGVSPTITTRPEGFKTAILPVVEPRIVEDFYQQREPRFYDKYAPCLRADRYGLKVAEPLAYDEQNGYIRKDGTVGTLTTDGSSPKHNNRVIVFTNNQKGYDEAFEGDSINLEQPNSKTRRGRVGHGVAQTLNTAPQQAVVESCYVSEKGVRYICDPQRGMATDINADICQPLTATGQANWTGSFISPDIESLERTSTTFGLKEPTKINLKDGSQITSDDNLSGLRIRKLTPKECFRLMAFSDEDFEKASQVNSNAQLYKQAGNSIVVKVLEYIFLQMGIEKSWENSFTETFSIRS